ncbi:hypothetical protein HN51_057583, partial [Arachis hypogaea]
MVEEVSIGGKEATFNSARLSSLSTVNEEGEASQRSFLTAFSCLSSKLETLDNDSLECFYTFIYNYILECLFIIYLLFYYKT